jgi:hypothetical protein
LVYDLRLEGKTFKEIGTALWPDRDGDLEKRARDYYLRGKLLVLNPPRLPRGKIVRVPKTSPRVARPSVEFSGVF